METQCEVEELVANLAPNSAVEVAGRIEEVYRLIGRSEFVRFERKNGQLAVAWGAATPSFVDDTLVVWCLFTNCIEGHGFTFIRSSRIIMKELHQRYPRILCYVRTEWPTRWVELIGFRKETTYRGYHQMVYHGT